MGFLRRLFDLLDWGVSKWPNAGGGVLVRRLLWRPRFRIMGRRVRIAENVRITGFERIAIGNDVSIMAGGYVYAHDSDGLTIGDGCSINHNVQLGASGGRIMLGAHVLIGPNVVLRAADHVFDDPDRPIAEQGHRFGEIIIEDDVWIGANAVVTSGVRIGRGVVIGAGSVVTRSIDPFTVAAGVPARVIRSRRR